MATAQHDLEKDYDGLLGLLASMVQAQSGRQIEDGHAWMNDRQTLAKKLAYHLRTIQSLRAGDTFDIDGAQSRFIDHGSITVLARAVVENVIVFAHVFGDPDLEASRFNHMAWKFGGVMDRQKRQAITEAARQTQEQERPHAEALLAEIKGHRSFQAFSKGKQKKIAQGGWSGGRQWQELAVDAGFNQRYFRTVYSYLCDYSHASYAAAMQVGQADTLEVQSEMSRSIIGVMDLCMARFIAPYAELFESAKEILEGSEAKLVASKWNLGSRNFEPIYGAEA